MKHPLILLENVNPYRWYLVTDSVVWNVLSFVPKILVLRITTVVSQDRLHCPWWWWCRDDGCCELVVVVVCLLLFGFPDSAGKESGIPVNLGEEMPQEIEDETQVGKIVIMVMEKRGQTR